MCSMLQNSNNIKEQKTDQSTTDESRYNPLSSLNSETDLCLSSLLQTQIWRIRKIGRLTHVDRKPVRAPTFVLDSIEG